MTIIIKPEFHVDIPRTRRLLNRRVRQRLSVPFEEKCKFVAPSSDQCRTFIGLNTQHKLL